MEYLCEFAIMNVDDKVDETICAQCFSYDYFADLDGCINVICEKLDIDKSLITVNPDNVYMQRATVISFKFKDRLCEFYEHYDSQVDYLAIRIKPVA